MVIINKWGSSLNYFVYSSGNGVLLDSGLLDNEKSAYFGLEEGFYKVIFKNTTGTVLTGIGTSPRMEAESLIELKTILISTLPHKK